MAAMNALVVVAVLFAVALPVLLILLYVVRQVAVRRRPIGTVLLGPGLLVGIALTFIGYAGLVYAFGLSTGFYILDPDQMCASAAGHDPAGAWAGLDFSAFPLRNTCRWNDGTTYELVPGWVNPLSYALLAVAWIALLARPVATLARPTSSRK